jgi:hypothetical protein
LKIRPAIWAQLGGEFSDYTGFLPPYSFPLPLLSSLPFSMPALGGCQILTLEAPLITEKAPCMYNGYLYSKDDVRSTFVKPPWIPCRAVTISAVLRLKKNFFKRITVLNNVDLLIKSLVEDDEHAHEEPGQEGVVDHIEHADFH